MLRTLEEGKHDLSVGTWFDYCDGARLHIGISRAAPLTEVRRKLRRARRILREEGATRDVRFIALRSSVIELFQAKCAIERELSDLPVGSYYFRDDGPRNAVEIRVGRSVSEPDRARIREVALNAPVNVVVHMIDEDLAIDMNYDSPPACPEKQT